MKRLPTDLRLRLLRDMVFVRRFEERCAQLYQQQRIRGFLHLYVGEEAVATGVSNLLTADDNVVGTYREHAHALLAGIPAEAILAEMFGRVGGCSGGRGGSMHLFDISRRFYGGNAIVAGGLPMAVGLALADRLRSDERITACFFGEGATAEGEFHESLNLAALWDLPVLFCCENNRYAMGTELARWSAQTDMALRASVYGIPSWSVDGMDVEAVHEATRRALVSIRAGGGPVFIEFETYRFRAHSMYDPERYRDRAEVDRWRERDPIALLVERMVTDGEIDHAHRSDLELEVDAAIEHAVDIADRSPLEDPSDLLRHVYAVSATVEGNGS